MDTVADVKFVVDEQYENEKGVFTVISIRGDDMLIRWVDGKEIKTTVSFQQMIQRRRQREALALQAKIDSDKNPTSASGTPW